MNEGRDVWSGGNLSDKGKVVNKSLLRGRDLYRSGELFPRIQRPTEVEEDEKAVLAAQEYVDKERRLREIGGPFATDGQGSWVEKAGEPPAIGEIKPEDEEEDPSCPGGKIRSGGKGKGLGRGEGEGPKGEPFAKGGDTDGPEAGESLDDEEEEECEGPKPGQKMGIGQTKKDDAETEDEEEIDSGDTTVEPFSKSWVAETMGAVEKSMRPFAGSPLVRKDRDSGGATLSKDVIEKVIKDAGWDKVPIPDKALEVIEDLISNGAKPVTMYTGKVMVERGYPEEPPALSPRPLNLRAGDTVIPLDWQWVRGFGAKFDMPYIPPSARVKAVHVAPVKVTKKSYPFGRVPSDISKVETVMEDRVWGIDLEEEGVKKDDDTFPSPVMVRDSTMVLRMEPLASPSGEVNPGSI